MVFCQRHLGIRIPCLSLKIQTMLETTNQIWMMQALHVFSSNWIYNISRSSPDIVCIYFRYWRMAVMRCCHWSTGIITNVPTKQIITNLHMYLSSFVHICQRNPGFLKPSVISKIWKAREAMRNWPGSTRGTTDYTIFQIIFLGHIPWDIGLKNRPS